MTRADATAYASAEAAKLRAWCLSDAFVRPLSTLDDMRRRPPADGGGEGEEGDDPESDGRGSLVFVNGEPVGVTDNEELYARVAREARREGILPHDCSIVRDAAWGGVAVFTDIGMMTRALLSLPALHRMPDAIDAAARYGTPLWDEMTRRGIVDWVDAWEATNYRIANMPAEVEAYLKRADPLEVPYTHLIPHPQSFFATAEATVPFPNHDQAPRVRTCVVWLCHLRGLTLPPHQRIKRRTPCTPYCFAGVLPGVHGEPGHVGTVVECVAAHGL